MSKSIDKLRKANKEARSNQKSSASKTQEVYRTNFSQPTIDTFIFDVHLQSFIPPLQPEEFALLEESIRKEGVREALLLWDDPARGVILIDGYNRAQIVKKLISEGESPRYNTKVVDFADFEAVKDWMLVNQLGRRNLTNEQRSYLRGVRYNREKARHGGDRRSSNQNDNLKTSERLAREYGVGEATIQRDSDLALGIDRIGQDSPNLKREVLAGQVKIKKSSLQTLGKFKGDNLPKLTSSDDIQQALLTISPQPKAVTKSKKKMTSDNAFSTKKNQIIQTVKDLSVTSSIKDIDQIQRKLELLKAFIQE